MTHWIAGLRDAFIRSEAINNLRTWISDRSKMVEAGAKVANVAGIATGTAKARANAGAMAVELRIRVPLQEARARVISQAVAPGGGAVDRRMLTARVRRSSMESPCTIMAKGKEITAQANTVQRTG